MRPALFLLFILSFASAQPNVVMIVSDDHHWRDYGFMGNAAVKTPNLDKLAANSAVFHQAYVPTSLCRASLASMLTGQYPHQHKITCNDPPAGVNRNEMLPLLAKAPSLPRLLKEKGYRSFQTGKFWEGPYENGGFTDGMTRTGRHGEEGLVIGRKTLQPIYDFIEKDKSPFFVWYAPMMPHMPHNPPARLVAKYTDAGLDANVAKYYAMIEWFDETVGELLAFLDKKGLRDNTMIVYVADNGWMQNKVGEPARGAQGAPRGKNSPYDNGLRTPILVSWPGHTKAGRYDDFASSIDLAPTILSACGVSVPKEMAGLSLLDAASGKARLAREAVFGELFVHTANDLHDPAKNLTHRWVRKGDWKLIVPVEGAPELYNVTTDPEEKSPVSDAARVAELRGLLDRWWKP